MENRNFYEWRYSHSQIYECCVHCCGRPRRIRQHRVCLSHAPFKVRPPAQLCHTFISGKKKKNLRLQWQYWPIAPPAALACTRQSVSLRSCGWFGADIHSFYSWEITTTTKKTILVLFWFFYEFIELNNGTKYGLYTFIKLRFLS